MAPPIIFGLKPISLTALTMPTESSGYEQITATMSGLAAWMARTIGAKSGGASADRCGHRSILRPCFLAFSWAPSQAFLGRTPGRRRRIATVCGFGFCATAASKKPSV